MLYLLSFANAKQQRYQKPLPVKQKKNGSSTGTPTHTSGLVVRRNLYNINTNTADIWKLLDQAKQIINQVNARGSAKDVPNKVAK